MDICNCLQLALTVEKYRKFINLLPSPIKSEANQEISEREGAKKQWGHKIESVLQNKFRIVSLMERFQNC